MRLAVIIFTMILCHGLCGQDLNRFRNFQGIKYYHGGVSAFEGEGYDIFIHVVNQGLDAKGISKIKRTYTKRKGVLTTDSVLHVKVLTGNEEQDGVTVFKTFYLLRGTTEESIVIGFVRPKTRDIDLERFFVNSYQSNAISDFVYTTPEIDSINFVGRSIKLDPVCNWMSPHNVQCHNFGQMNWAIFDNQKQAEDYRDLHFAMTKNKSAVDIKEEKWIPVKLEGKETMALRTKVKVRMPLFVEGQNLLIVYYVTAEVRGKFVTCVLSQYSNDSKPDELAPLLAEVLTLQAPDGSWKEKSSIDSSTDESLAEEDSQTSEDQHGVNNDFSMFKIEAGVWAPVGGLSRAAGISPNLGLWLTPYGNADRGLRVDFGFSFFIPLRRREFDYYLSDSTFKTKLEFSGLIGFQVVKTTKINDRAFIDEFDHVYGLGFAAFTTTTEKPKKNPEDEDESYHFNTLYLNYGWTFRKKVFEHKSIGLALRYNFTPTRLFSSHVQKGFGNSSMTASLQFKF